MASEHQTAGRIAVEPMRQRGRARQAKAQRVEIVLQAHAALGPLMHGKARRLVDDQHQGVAVEQAALHLFRCHDGTGITAIGMSDSTNAAVWRPSIARAGAYRVSVYVPNRAKLDWGCGGVTAIWDTSNAVYQIKHRDGLTSYAVNQQPLGDDWVVLGTYYFAAGSEGYVKLSDLTGEPSNTRWVTMDEAKWEWVQP